MKRRTKIVATLGPASESRAMIRSLMHGGVDVFRLNFSHGTQEEKAELIAIIREEAANWPFAVAILVICRAPRFAPA